MYKITIEIDGNGYTTSILKDGEVVISKKMVRTDYGAKESGGKASMFEDSLYELDKELSEAIEGIGSSDPYEIMRALHKMGD